MQIRKTFITRVPDKPGACLSPVRIISELGLKIIRLSYNNAVDNNLLFIEVKGNDDLILKAETELKILGFMFEEEKLKSKVILFEFMMPEKFGTIQKILEEINNVGFNISYMSFYETLSETATLRIAICVDDSNKFNIFFNNVSKICEFKIIDYDSTEKNLDNTVFYLSFAQQIAEKLRLEKESVSSLIEYTNIIMQTLDEKDQSFHKTFDYIAKYADLVSDYRGENFKPRILSKQFNDFSLYSIEPPVGSNTYIIRKNNSLLFIDGGFRIYRHEMENIARGLFNDFDSLDKKMILTHPDVDHAGLMEWCNEIYVSKKTYINYEEESLGRKTWRELDEVNKPYLRLTKVMTEYKRPDLSKLKVIDNGSTNLFDKIGEIDFEGLKIDILTGNGGHVPGEIVAKLDNIWFIGDIMVNAKEYIPAQAEFNILAPYLIRSVNLNSKLAKEARLTMESMIPDSDIICYGHGKPRW